MRRTSFGDAACPAARALDEIGDWWTLQEPMQVMVDKAAGRPIGRLRLTARDGHTLDPGEVVIKMGRAGR